MKTEALIAGSCFVAFFVLLLLGVVIPESFWVWLDNSFFGIILAAIVGVIVGMAVIALTNANRNSLFWQLHCEVRSLLQKIGAGYIVAETDTEIERLSKIVKELD